MSLVIHEIFFPCETAPDIKSDKNRFSYKFFKFLYDLFSIDSFIFFKFISRIGLQIGDAIKSIDTPVIEIHISNTFSRESFRHNSYITPVAKGLIVGFGLDSYRLGVETVFKK